MPSYIISHGVAARRQFGATQCISVTEPYVEIFYFFEMPVRLNLSVTKLFDRDNSDSR